MARPETTPEATWRRIVRGDVPLETLRLRAGLIERTRAFFRERGFLEADPPIASSFPNIDPNVFPVEMRDASGIRSTRYLHTSPELSLKKLLAAGSGNLFCLGKVFRDREGSPLHSNEFTMLEWYRVGEGADAVMKDVEELVRELARAATGKEEICRGGSAFPLPPKWSRLELSEAFDAHVGAPMGDEEALRAALRGKGARPADREVWEDLFFRALVDVIEPALSGREALFLTGFPRALGAMAKRRPEDPSVSERFEGYLAGVELVNGYEELTDALEQEERMRELSARHAHRTGTMLPVDPDFLDALRHGLPPCSGAALGMDRLVMLLLGKESIADVTIR